MYQIRPVIDKKTGQQKRIATAWDQNTVRAWEIYDTEHPKDPVTGTWTLATAEEICASMNQGD
jgi:hypothetical protein